MLCPKCSAALADDFLFCPYCGRSLAERTRNVKRRGNGQGSVFKLPNGKYKAFVTVGYYTDDEGKKHRKTKSRTFDKKKDAVEALATLGKEAALEKEKKRAITFKALYDQWYPTHTASAQTMGCYSAAVKHFSDIYTMQIGDVDVDDLQECLDNCPAGRRTRENMRAVVGLMYKYGIPRHMIPDNLNLAPFLTVTGEAAVHRESFTDEQIKKIRAGIGKIPYSDYVYVMIYTGFRPSEFLALTGDSYDSAHCALVGGSKTDAGINRVVTLSPKIKPLVEAQAGHSGQMWNNAQTGEAWLSLQQFTRQCFYPTLDALGIDNPVIEIAGGVKRRRYTPHTCRHTFSTLMKRIAGADKDKLALIGHSSSEMLRYYQDVNYADLEKITDQICFFTTLLLLLKNRKGQ